ncbi:MAG: hypothetical protein JWN72_1756 [Thermoleophilia bacterium]|nr:hypothetical protein [Thermoleophilia bacterium]
MTVSNLVMTFDEPAMPPAESARMPIDPPMHRDVVDGPVLTGRSTLDTRSFTYDLLALDQATDWTPEHEDVRDTDVAHAERLLGTHAEIAAERRSAFEIAFIVLACALGIMVATPPLVQLFLAMRGIQA